MDTVLGGRLVIRTVEGRQFREPVVDLAFHSATMIPPAAPDKRYPLTKDARYPQHCRECRLERNRARVRQKAGGDVVGRARHAQGARAGAGGRVRQGRDHKLMGSPSFLQIAVGI